MAKALAEIEANEAKEKAEKAALRAPPAPVGAPAPPNSPALPAAPKSVPVVATRPAVASAAKPPLPESGAVDVAAAAPHPYASPFASSAVTQHVRGHSRNQSYESVFNDEEVGFWATYNRMGWVGECLR